MRDARDMAQDAARHGQCMPSCASLRSIFSIRSNCAPILGARRADLIQAWRAGNVVLLTRPAQIHCNPWFLAPALQAGAPAIARVCRPSPTGGTASKCPMSHCCRQLAGNYVIKPTYNDRGRRFVLGKALSPRGQRDQWAGRVSTDRRIFRRGRTCRCRTAELAANRWALTGAATINSPRRRLPRVFCLDPMARAAGGCCRSGGLARLAPPGKDVRLRLPCYLRPVPSDRPGERRGIGGNAASPSVCGMRACPVSSPPLSTQRTMRW